MQSTYQHLDELLLQEQFVQNVTKMIQKKLEDTQKTKSGWFTPEMMKSELKWSTCLERTSCFLLKSLLNTVHAHVCSGINLFESCYLNLRAHYFPNPFSGPTSRTPLPTAKSMDWSRDFARIIFKPIYIY